MFFYSSMIILLPTLMPFVASYTILGFREKRWYSTSLRRLQWLKKKKQIWLPLSYIHACMHSFWNSTYIITITIAQVDFHSQNLIKRVSAVAHVLVRKLWKVASLEPWHRPDRRRGQDHTTHPSLTFFLLHLLLLSQTKPKHKHKHKPLFFDPLLVPSFFVFGQWLPLASYD